MRNSLKIIFAISCTLTSVINASGQVYDFDSLVDNSSNFKAIAKIIGDTTDLFNSNIILEVTLESDFKNLVKRKLEDEYQEAIFRMMINDTIQVSRKIKIRPRGHMRKNSCQIPPIKLNFTKKEAFLKQIGEFDKMKMVLDCKRGDAYQQYLFSEYYAYKIQNIITDYSLRVRLLQVKYIDTGGKYKESTRYAFILESIQQLAQRHNAVRIETKNIRDLNTDRKTLVDAYLFQYLIGNCDWSIPGMHNIYMLKSNDSSIVTPFVVPYDLDYAGIVNATYAVPPELLGTESVRERVYRGVCLPESDLYNSAELFINKKEQIYEVYENDTLMSKNNKRSTINYLDEFFKILENKKSFSRNIIESCR